MTEKIVNISDVKKKQKGMNKFLLLFLLIVIFCFLLMSPVFSVKNIYTEGFLYTPENSIIDASGIYYGQNIFCINKVNAVTRILNLPYVDDVEIRRSLPGSIRIFIKEKAPLAEAHFYGSKLIISEDGILLNVITDDEETNLPMMKGISATDITTGKLFESTNKEQFQTFLDVLNNLKKNGMINDVIQIEDKDGVLVYLKEGHIANFGDSSNLQYKILLLKEIIPKEKNTAYIDLSNLERKVTKPVWGVITE